MHFLPGCGASCIYPLLAAKKNNWLMTGIEVDAESHQSALRNVQSNQLGHRITILRQPPESGIFDLLLEGNSKTFDFCLCNPPFYDESTSMEPKNRTGTRRAPRNAKTGSQVELSCQGGELSFIRKIFAASLKFKSRIRVFTTMIGIKNDLVVLVKELRRLGVTNFTETEFCQGRTTRWGLAWTFAAEHDNETYLRTVPSIRSNFVKEPAIFFIPEADPDKVVAKGKIVEEALFKLLRELKIEPRLLPEHLPNEKRFRIAVSQVTWTNTRRKRREQERSCGESEECPAPVKRQRIDSGKSILVADIYLNHVENGQTLQIFYLDGLLGKDSCQQILQFIINRFNEIFD